MNGPPTIDHFVGQHQLIARLRVVLEAAWSDGSPLPHILFLGPPGTGKTTIAQILAREMGTTLHERLGQTLENASAVNNLLMEAGDGIAFIDEIHEMPRNSQTLLYRSMEDRTIFLTGRDSRTLSLPVGNFTLLAATTDEYSLLSPLRDRFKVLLPFSFYEVVSEPVEIE